MHRTCLTAVVLVLLAAVLAPASYAGSGPRPDLVVGPGSLELTGATVEVSASVANRGGRRARASRAAVLVDGVQRAVVPVRKVRRGKARVVTAQLQLAAGRHTVSVCADSGATLRERRERNNCRTLGAVDVLPTAVSSAPTQPLTYTADTPQRVAAADGYWLRVPASYDPSHATPAPLLVFLHGCYDTAWNQMASLVRAADLSRAVVMVPELGRDGACWDLGADPARLRAAIADLRSRVNVDPARVVLGGYSSGALLAGRTALTEGPSYAGLLVMMGSAFYGDRTSLLAGASARFPVAWRSHTGDETFRIEDVRADQRAMAAAGFAVTVSETGGTHTYADSDLAWLVSRSPT